MRTEISLKMLCGCVLLFATLPGRSSAQAAAAPQAAPAVQSAQPASICGGRAGCYETADFAAVMTDFRVSTSGGWKVIDTTLHVQNKTNQPLILGYTEGSAMAIDDQGNRYGLANQPNAVRGIGRIQGNSIDPKFNLPPGGAGDTMFELAWPPGNATQGVNFELDLSIREIKALEGGQFSLAGETPLQFRGLANGAFGGSTAGTAAGGVGAAGGGLLGTSGTATTAGAAPVCGSGSSGLSSVAANANAIGGQSVQNAPASANSAISNASAQIASLKSMFGHKKAAAAAATPAAASAATPCVPAASASGATAAASATPAVAASTSAVGQSAATPAVAPASAATTPSAAQPAARVSQAAPAGTTAVAHTTTVTTVTTTKKAVATPAKKPAPATTSTTSPK